MVLWESRLENSFLYASFMAVSLNNSMLLSITEEHISLLVFLIVFFNFQKASCENCLFCVNAHAMFFTFLLSLLPLLLSVILLFLVYIGVLPFSALSPWMQTWI